MDKDSKKVIAELERQGFTTKRTSKGHTAVYKDDKWVTTFAGTASDHRALKNGIAACKRVGFRWPP